MTPAGFPKYRRGQRVKTAVDLINDHSFPDREPEGVLLAAGAPVRSSTSRSIPKRTCRSTLSILVSSCSSAALKKKSQCFEWRLSP